MSLRLPGEDAPPVVSHTDDRPTAPFCACHEGLREGTQFRFWSVGIFARRIVLMHEPHEAPTLTGLGVFKHGLITVSIARQLNERPRKTLDYETSFGSICDRRVATRDIRLSSAQHGALRSTMSPPRAAIRPQRRPNEDP
jgi:hypothetical protein